MTKADIVNVVAATTGIEKITVASVIDETIDTIKDSVSKGEPVYLRNFGSFQLKKRAEKTARNITKGTTITIPAREVPAFKVSKAFIVKK